MKFDWNRARAFLVTAEEGSLSAAARALGMAQPTLGRQVRTLEEELGVVLFERAGKGLILTPSGVELVEHVRAMGEAATRVSLSASGQSQSVEGSVTITATEVASAFVLPSIVAKLRVLHPGIQIEIVATNALRDLRRREADIAVRSVRPSDPNLIARRVKDGTARLYGAKSYLAAAGDLSTPEALSAAAFIGFDENEQFVQALESHGLKLSSNSFPILCGSHLVQWEMVKSGLGIGVMTEHVGDAEPLVARVAPWLPGFQYEIWIVAHRALNSSRRVRIVFDRLLKELQQLA